MSLVFLFNPARKVKLKQGNELGMSRILNHVLLIIEQAACFTLVKTTLVYQRFLEFLQTDLPLKLTKINDLIPTDFFKNSQENVLGKFLLRSYRPWP